MGGLQALVATRLMNFSQIADLCLYATIFGMKHHMSKVLRNGLESTMSNKLGVNTISYA